MASQPDLARFSFDMLALPATSAECERVFSSAKLLITVSRNRLLPEGSGDESGDDGSDEESDESNTKRAI